MNINLHANMQCTSTQHYVIYAMPIQSKSTQDLAVEIDTQRCGSVRSFRHSMFRQRIIMCNKNCRKRHEEVWNLQSLLEMDTC
jgi:hypothetical protein